MFAKHYLSDCPQAAAFVTLSEVPTVGPNCYLAIAVFEDLNLPSSISSTPQLDGDRPDPACVLDLEIPVDPTMCF